MEKYSPQQWETQTKLSGSLIAASLLLGAVIAVSAWVAFLNAQSRGHIVELRDKNTEIEQTISLLKSSPDIQKMEIISRSSELVEREIALHRIDRLIDGVTALRRDANIELSGFAYANGVITTQGRARPDTTGSTTAIQKITALLAKYRTENGLLFDLAPVYALSWDASSREFWVTLTVNEAELLKLDSLTGSTN